ncbi:sugar transferase [Sporolactobacillus pectinivorans]|uniref:sugar transferase n=1 Tax=Sporolactobacillus pectinivorans TaxID=1591408 RepID=UPI0023D80B71|nr:sugar transferase [Sporolactobacillus pectinivorans]
MERHNLYLFVKRLSDIVLSSLGLVLLSPVFLLVSLLIKLDDPKGKVIFSQTRVGENGKEFVMFKFRSMVPDAEHLLEKLLDRNDTDGLMFKIREDPRITRIGRFIRKTSVDELPQLFNVLKGDMSLVGPRPPIPREVSAYSAYEWQRLLVRPGCTGPWQVGGRSSLGFDQMVELDLYYIHHRNFSTDMKLIAKTIFLLFGSKNAY